MTVYKLLWELIKHVLHGRGKDEVTLYVRAAAGVTPGVGGPATDFEWEGDQDKFCTIIGHQEIP